MSKLRLRTQLLMWLLLALALLLIPLWVITVRTAQSAAQTTLERALYSRLGFLKATLEISPKALSQITNDFGGIGFIVSDGELSWSETEPSPEDIEAMAAIRPLFAKSLHGFHKDKIWVALEQNQKVFGLLVPASEISKLPQIFAKEFLQVGLVLLLAAWAVGAWGLNRALKPVQKLGEQIAERNADSLEAIPLPGLVELRPPVASLNQLMQELSNSFSRLKKQEQAAQRFAYGASHELRNPLAALSGYLQVLQKNPGEMRAIEGATIASERMQSLLDSLLTLARLEGKAKAKTEKVLIKDLTRKYFDIDIESEAKVEVDENLFELLAINLVNNSQKHGALPLSVRVEEKPETTWLYIDDCGPGFPPESVNEVFTPFTKEGDGTGLGLSIVAAVMNVHGGEVFSENLAIGGARIGLGFPVLSQS